MYPNYSYGSYGAFRMSLHYWNFLVFIYSTSRTIQYHNNIYIMYSKYIYLYYHSAFNSIIFNFYNHSSQFNII
ncbi:hypothetical protein F383_02701 [Gossypium arboreum]|uniref:Uncharacterized protein n=1 Tax=Gossypium arboreum TaxID=29729 RepID=A0A0B0PUV0_GOSAR|nr:hypothetical protein F383_02701 [Gossypium arboreum]